MAQPSDVNVDDLRRRARRRLVGAIVLAKVEQGEIDAAQLRRWLDQALTREDDRELFRLEVLAQKGAHTEG